MRNDLASSCLGFVVLVATATAQTTVTTSGTTSSGTVPVFGPSSNTRVTNSPITISGSNVGIGTASPTQKLEVNGTAQIDGNTYTEGASYVTSGGTTSGMWQDPVNSRMALGTSGSTIVVGSMTNTNPVSFHYTRYDGTNWHESILGYTDSSNQLQFQSSGGQVQVIGGNGLSVSGNLGIGTTSPGEVLEIGNSGNLRVTGDNFGINVDSSGAWSYNNWLYKVGWNSALGDWAYFAPSGNHPAVNDAAMILDGNVLFGTGEATGDGLTGEWMRITGGNVGIGTASPAQRLEINGNAQIDGGIYFAGDPTHTPQTTPWTGVLCGGDYAEAMNAAGGKAKYEPGDVLVLTSEDRGDVEKSSAPYSTMVAGIVAAKPGVVGLRAEVAKLSDNVPMAMVGVVPRKVSAGNGPIHRGDLLVTASVAGYAMKGTDHSQMLGAVIGKAMGSLDSGTGMIEVLVTLQ